MATVTIRLNDDSITDLSSRYKNHTFGAQAAVNGFLTMQKATLYELKGIFSRIELYSIFAALNGYKMIPEHQANRGMFIAQLQHYEMMEQGLSKMKIEFKLLLPKLNSLTSAQVFFLQDEIISFWNKRANNERVEDALKPFLA